MIWMLADTCPFLGHWYPFLDFWWHLLWVSKPEWILPYSLFYWGECNVHSLRSTSCVTHTTSWQSIVQLVTSPHASTEVGLGLDLNGQSPGQKTNALQYNQNLSIGSFLYLGKKIPYEQPLAKFPHLPTHFLIVSEMRNKVVNSFFPSSQQLINPMYLTGGTVRNAWVPAKNVFMG